MSKKNGNGKNGRLPAKVKKAGRPKALTATKKRNFLAAIKVGVPLSMACDAAGINVSTFYNWKNRLDREPEGSELWAFFQEIKKREAQGLQENLERILAAAAEPRNWTASAWWLERRYPQHFGKAVQVSADVKQTTVDRKEVVLQILTDEKTRDIANQLAFQLAGQIDGESIVAPSSDGKPHN